MQLHLNEPLECCFSLVGVDASFANAFRRILLAEVPTLAIEKVYVRNNTSVIADEVLAHRLGLIPLRGSVDGLNWMRWWDPGDPENNIPPAPLTDYNTVVLELKVICERNPETDPNETDPNKKYIKSNVYAKSIVWEPMGQQSARFADGPIEPVNPDILIAKLRPGQEIDVVMHAQKGKGMDHAKFSPVATATYRLLPTITLTKPILNEDAKNFQKCFPPGVIGLERVTSAEANSDDPDYHGREGDIKAVVRDVFKDTVSRECLRHDEFKNKVRLARVQDHFVFNIESTGQFNSDLLFLESVKVLKYKAARLKKALDSLNVVGNRR